MTNIISSLLLMAFFSVFSLQNSFAEEDKRKEITTSLKDQIISLLEENEKIHASMFEYNKEKLQKRVALFKKKALKVKSLEVKKLLEPALDASTELIKNKSKEEDNESYHRFSLSLVKIVETYKIGTTYNIYYCPMVKKRWVQNSSQMRKVHNPYAPEMPHCGGQITEF